jgi:hypothetical protein
MVQLLDSRLLLLLPPDSHLSLLSFVSLLLLPILLLLLLSNFLLLLQFDDLVFASHLESELLYLASILDKLLPVSVHKGVSIEFLMPHLSFLQNLLIDSLRIEYFVFNGLEIKCAILRGLVCDSELGVISHLRQLPLDVSVVIIMERVLFNLWIGLEFCQVLDSI